MLILSFTHPIVFFFDLLTENVFGFLQPSTEDEAPAAATTPTKVPKSVSDKKRFFESAMEDQHKPTQKTGEFKKKRWGQKKRGSRSIEEAGRGRRDLVGL